MGISKDASRGSTFSKDILKVEISRPDQQPLTLVDLPGLIQVDNRDGADVEMVKDIVDEYVSNPRSIILAVVSANIDAVTQGILRKAKQVDPEGKRTFGIITKPDLAGKGSDQRRTWIEYAQNREEFQFHKGWHVLLNRNYSEVKDQTSSDIRDQNEQRFFHDPTNEWSEIKAGSWGIESLRDRLRNLLYDLTRSQLPSVQGDITMKLNAYDDELKALNARLKTQEEMWETFREKCHDIADMVEKGATGKYHDAFYDIDVPDNVRYLRANIEKEYNSLHTAMESRGRGIFFPGIPVESDGVPAIIDPRWVETAWETLQRTLGDELQGQSDPQRLDLMFWTYSKPWFGIASEHIGKCFRHCERFISYVVESQLNNELPGLSTILRKGVLRETLGARKERAEKELGQLEEDRKRSTKTRNKAFPDKSQQTKNQKLFQTTLQAVHAGKAKAEMEMGLNANFIAKSLDLDKFDKLQREKAEELLREMLIYYNVRNHEHLTSVLFTDRLQIARDVFVDNVLIQVIERHLLNKIHRDFRDGMGVTRERFNQIWRDEGHDARVIKRDEVQKERDTLWECLNKVESAMNSYS
jgi:hypothetical protein